MQVWTYHFWDELSSLARITEEVRAFVKIVETDNGTAGWALEKWISMRGHLEEVGSDLALAERTKLNMATESRDTMVFNPWVVASNIMDPRYKGRSLTGARLREGVRFLKAIPNRF